jgi:Tol biopolymer transport system component
VAVRARRAARLALLVVLGSAVITATAEASYPGSNGRIAFVRSGGIYSVKPDGSSLLRLTTAAGDNQPVWSPSGRRIAFIRSGNVWTMNGDGSHQLQVTTSTATESSPTWSPNGSRLAFQSDRVGHWRFDVYTLHSSPPYGTLVRLTNFPFDLSQGECPANHSPSWGANGKIAFVHDQSYCDDFNSYPTLYTMNGDGSHQASRNEVCRCYGNQLDWAPTGATLLFVAYNGSPDAAEPFEFDGSDVWTQSPTGQLRNLSSSIPRWYYDETAAFSPSGTRVVFQSTYDNALSGLAPTPRGIWVMHSDGTQRGRIVFNGTDPNWGPAPS